MNERFVCPRCGKASSHPTDKAEGYCGSCHDWTGAEDPWRVRLAEVVRTHGEPPPSRVYGPYSTSRDANADAAELACGAFRTPEDASAGEPQYVALVNACTRAGIDLGVFDERILVWLSHWEPSTVQVVVGLISRANRSPNQEES